MHPRAIRRRGSGFSGRVAAAALIIYLGLVLPAAAANRSTQVRVLAIRSIGTSSQLARSDTPRSWQRTKHFSAARRLSWRSMMRRMDLSSDGESRKNQRPPSLLVADLAGLISRSAMIDDCLIRPVRSFYCLQEHIRERAPPILENPI